MSASWRLTDVERRKVVTSLLSALSTFVGPLGPLVMWSFDYLYDRRDLMFSASAAPLRAYTSTNSSLALTGSSRALVAPAFRQRVRIIEPQSTMAIKTKLTDSARDLGLRKGDPVSVVVSRHSQVQTSSGLWIPGCTGGLVVPARIGQPVVVTVPSGEYSLAALGGRQTTLFTTRDPYTALTGRDVDLLESRELSLKLDVR